VITHDKNHIPWNKYHIPPPRKPRMFFPTELSFFDRKTSEALGAHHLQATVTMLLWMRFLNVWDNVPLDLKYDCQQYFTCTVCVFLVSFGLIKHLQHAGSGNMKIYSPTSIIFPSGVALREYDTLGWINVHISLTRMQ
jgi:hypothetical protein